MAADRSRLPRLGPEPSFTFPEIRRGRLTNGLDVWTAEHHDVPLVSVLVLVRAGAAFDPAVRPGLAAITGGVALMGRLAQLQLGDEEEEVPENPLEK